jgi:ABC-type Fe3+/spermidine/putrescine transport system ATPase subunit
MLQVEAISKSWDSPVLTDFSLQAEEGEVVGLLGPSGSGKSTVLRIIAGLETPDEGRILIDDEDVTEMPPESRGVGMVFQGLALFPHLNVEGNIAFGVADRSRRAELVEEMLDKVGLAGFNQRRIDSLSGGEAQRVALARSLVAQPRVLLLDEPLSSLDSHLKQHLAEELRAILKATGTTAIYVTHDEAIANLVSDRIVHLRRGEDDYSESE